MRILLSAIFILGIFITSCAQGQMKPQETEVWEPEPVKVRPGMFGSPPSDAIVLLGEDLSEWESTDGGDAKWSLVEGIMTVVPGTGGLQTRREFGSVQLHIEWRSPPVIEEATGQGRGNSGVFLQSKYEVQVLDSYNNRTYSNGQAGSIYKQYIPLVNAMRPPLEWQVYDIVFEAPEFEGGKVIKPGFLTVFHNGVIIQNHVELKGETVFIGNPGYNAHGDLPLMLQDHGNTVSFRNIWVRELD